MDYQSPLYLFRTWFNTKIIAIIPIFIAVNIAAIFVWYFEITKISMPLILGVIAGGLVDLDNNLKGRISNLFYTLIAFSISSLIVQLTFINHSLFILSMALMAFTFTMFGVIGQRHNTIAFGSLVVSLYTMLTYNDAQIWYLNSVLILIGTILYSLLSMLIYLLFPLRPIQEKLAKTFFDLAEYLDCKASFYDPDDDLSHLNKKQLTLAMKNSQLIDSFNNCRTSLLYRLGSQYYHNNTTQMINQFFAAQSIHEQMNSNYFRYPELLQELKYSDLLFRIQRLLELQAQACRDIANDLQQHRQYHYNQRLEQVFNHLEASFEQYRQSHQQSKNLANFAILLTSLQSINHQIRYLNDNNSAQSNDSILSLQAKEEHTLNLKEIWQLLKSQCSFESQFFRHALRLAIVVAICCSIVKGLNLERGYWILLTAVFVCQPNYTATRTRLKQRIIGTLLGVLVGSLLPYFTSSIESKLGIVVATSTLFLFFRTNNYSFSTFFITIQVLMSFNILGLDIASAIIPRVIDTLIGSTITWLAVSYLWPDWKYLRLDYILDKTIKYDARYLLIAIVQLHFGQRNNSQYRQIYHMVYNSASALSTTVSNMNYEANKDRDRLNNAFELLKLNSSLVSYITALSACYQHINTHFPADLYLLARRLMTLLEQLDRLEQTEFNDNITSIQKGLTEFSMLPEAESKGFNLPVQQLQMLTQVLILFYTAYHQEKCLTKNSSK
ncbi:TIGR01666 family membrane protein [Mergibacter septicus]|uniref:TIGR01666 family membrane protein n=1 Tax=Mergibacter septicus TaxID=221402 RepID=A0A8D4LNV2_9PAST|nr:YccS family putative transporter [Mergibacter septicus]AWX15396.1 TIGR01666 family membrane protein [Mergibacter septicus]QDJ14650.1 TIGR01666 family membrane protein [Mergibacter septicus]UTU47919.1 TIGR01666 family membrane protein [Mergibacter septicus]WMR96476.1 YccS family putative transporter [Mergibacter septicus]